MIQRKNSMSTEGGGGTGQMRVVSADRPNVDGKIALIAGQPAKESRMLGRVGLQHWLGSLLWYSVFDFKDLPYFIATTSSDLGDS
jgi:hypothetical protein